MPYLIPSLADIIFITLLFITCGKEGLKLLNDCDTGHHIRAGEIILNTLKIPSSDPFSFITPPLPWTVHEWLSEVIMALLHRLGGLTAVVVFFGILIAATYYIFLRQMKSQGYSVLAATAITILLCALAQLHWLARPHTFSMLIMVGWYSLLNSYQYQQRDRLWLLPILMLLWVNIHGGYIVGFVLVAIFMTGDCLQEYFSAGRVWSCRTKKYALVSLACLLAALFNPFSYKIFLFPFQLVNDTYLVSHIQEYISPNFHEEAIFKYVLLAMLAILPLLKKRLAAIELLLILCFTNMALTSVRYIPLFALFVLPVLFKGLTLPKHPLLEKITSFFVQREETIASVDRLARGILWPAVATITVLALAYSGVISYAFDPKIKPTAAVEFITKNQISGNVFNDDEFGDLLIYQTSGKHKVFIDGRLDMYGAKRLTEYFAVLDIKPGWEAIMKKYETSWVFYPTDSPFVRHLVTLPEWKLIYSDPVASILVQDIPLHSTLIALYPKVTLAKPLKE